MLLARLGLVLRPRLSWDAVRCLGNNDVTGCEEAAGPRVRSYWHIAVLIWQLRGVNGYDCERGSVDEMELVDPSGKKAAQGLQLEVSRPACSYM